MRQSLASLYPAFRSRYAHTPFGSSVTQHSEGPMDTVSSIMDQTMAD